MVRITMRVCGADRRTRRVSSMPSMPGRPKSITATSGFVRSTSSRPASPSAASPATAKPASASAVRRPARVSAWSSTKTTLTITACRKSGRCSGAFGKRQLEHERAAAGGRAFVPNCPTVVFCDAAHDVQAESRPGADTRSIRCEPLEEMFAQLRIDAIAGVRDAQDRTAILDRDADDDRPAFRRPLDRIRDQVHHCAPDLALVSAHNSIRIVLQRNRLVLGMPDRLQFLANAARDSAQEDPASYGRLLSRFVARDEQ